MEQLGFRDMELARQAATAKAAGDDLEMRLKIVGRAIDRKDFCQVADLSPSYASEILNGSPDGKRFHVGLIPVLAALIPDLFIQEVIAPLCELAGYSQPIKKRALTAEEELDRVLRIVRDHGLQPVFQQHGVDL